MQGGFKSLAAILAVMAVGLFLMVIMGIPLITEAIDILETGVGLKAAAKWSFGITIALFLVFAVVAGDGLLGELQYMLLSFFAFFAIITLLIAWAF